MYLRLLKKRLRLPKAPAVEIKILDPKAKLLCGARLPVAKVASFFDALETKNHQGAFFQYSHQKLDSPKEIEGYYLAKYF